MPPNWRTCTGLLRVADKKLAPLSRARLPTGTTVNEILNDGAGTNESPKLGWLGCPMPTRNWRWPLRKGFLSRARLSTRITISAGAQYPSRVSRSTDSPVCARSATFKTIGTSHERCHKKRRHPWIGFSGKPRTIPGCFCRSNSIAAPRRFHGVTACLPGRAS